MNITGLGSPAELEKVDNSIIRPMPLSLPSLASQVSFGNQHRQQDARSRKKSLGLFMFIKVDSSGDRFRQWPDKGCAPSSELPTHLAVHNMLIQINSTARVLLHAHVTELIALTQINKFCSTEALNRLLWSMHPELHLFIPAGLAFIPYDLPGTSDIALASSLALKDHSVAVWEKHGVLTTGKSVTGCIRHSRSISKAARIYFMVKGTGHEPEGLTDEQLNELAN